jgi:conjugative transposon TraM protein
MKDNQTKEVKMTLTGNGKRQVQKYAVFTLLFFLFAGCMWLIFSYPSAESEAKQSGFNTDVPLPKEESIVVDKRDAYDQEEMRRKQQQRMYSLEEFITDAAEGVSEESHGVDISLYKETAASGVTPIQSSRSAYHDINRTLASFYEAPREDPEKEALKREIEELRSLRAVQPPQPPGYDEQVALMEKSYALAAKYLPSAGRSGTEAVAVDYPRAASGVIPAAETAGALVRRAGDQTVSSLAFPLNDAESEASGLPRNMGFLTAEGERTGGTRNTLNAVVHNDRTITDGQSLRLRLTEPVRVGDRLIPVHTLLAGWGHINGERLEIDVRSIEYEGTIIPVKMTAYDTDGQRGIYIPGSMEMNALREIAANAGQNLGQSINLSQQDAAEQLLTDLGRGAIQGTSAYLSKKIRQVKVTLKAGHRLLLLPSGNEYVIVE